MIENSLSRRKYYRKYYIVLIIYIFILCFLALSINAQKSSKYYDIIICRDYFVLIRVYWCQYLSGFYIKLSNLLLF